MPRADGDAPGAMNRAPRRPDNGRLPNGARNSVRSNGGQINGGRSNGAAEPARNGPAPARGTSNGGAQRVGAPAGGVRVRPPTRPVAPVVPPQRGPARDDEPTEVHGPLAPAEDQGAPADAAPAAESEKAAASTPAVEIPGRHRRRAGQTPGSRPAAEYKAQADAARNGRKVRPGRRRRENFWRELPLLIVVALLLTFLIQTFLAKVYVIPSGSMEQTLLGCTGCNNDRVLVDKVTYRFTDPAPGDVVVFRGPDSWSNTEFSVPKTDNALVNGLQQFGSLIGLAPPDEKDFVKRVIAVGGQTVQCCDSRNRVLVDGEPLEEPYLYYVPEAGPRQDPFDPVTIPDGQLWMMGDSRNNSADSRASGHGPVPVANVIGQARLIVLPFPRFGGIPSIDPQPSDAVGMPAALEGAGTPLALGLLGTFPIALWRRRRTGLDPTFLP